jgi:alcohol dehydrogenase class IV
VYHYGSDNAIIVESHTAFLEQLNIGISDSERVLIVATKRARDSGAIPPEILTGRLVHWFADFSSNPRLTAACAAAAQVEELRPGAIIGLGGGSAIDVAKAARVLPADTASTLETMRSGFSSKRVPSPGEGPRLIAVPTLSGSGAEVTQFATTFHDGRKVSIDDTWVRPDLAIIDPSLAATAPHLATSAAILDAFCHAIESAWSRPATPTSRGYSQRALQHLAMVGWKTDGAYNLEDRRAMAAGALSAGQAINLTRTTAAHACAYMLTMRYGIPHGIACALNMQWVAKANLGSPGIASEAAAVIRTSLGIPMADLPEYFLARLSGAGWPTHLSSYGVQRSDLSVIAIDATHQARLLNNPVDLTTGDVEDGLCTIL